VANQTNKQNWSTRLNKFVGGARIIRVVGDKPAMEMRTSEIKLFMEGMDANLSFIAFPNRKFTVRAPDLLLDSDFLMRVESEGSVWDFAPLSTNDSVALKEEMDSVI